MYVYELIFANNLAGVGQAGAILLTCILLIVTNTITVAQIIYFGEKSTEINLAFAFFLISALPIVILYLFTQKYIIAGITSGAVKG